MPNIVRNPEQAAREAHDVIIVGGGIYGAMLMLESARAGLKPLLLEKADFGGGTSFNNLRIVHGGLRYLQTMHLARIRESVAERRWFLKTYPEFVKPLQCLMPLYGGLTKNSLTLNIALRMNDWLSRNRNEGLNPSQQLPDGEVIDASETKKRFPQVREEGLQAGAVWYDAVMPDCHRIEIEILRWAIAAGGTALNYAEVTKLTVADGRAAGVSVVDNISKSEHEFRSDIVINAAGPSCRALSAQFDTEHPELFHPSLAWNLLIDRPPLSEGAVAIEPPKPDSQVLFAHSLGGKLVVGTGHVAVQEGDLLIVDQDCVDQMLSDVNLAVPGLELQPDEVVRLFSGQLPASRAGTNSLSDTPVFLDHQEKGGPSGLFTVSGVKYTTARSTAASAIARIVRAKAKSKTPVGPGLPDRPDVQQYELHPNSCPDRDERMRRAKILIENEAPRSLEDLLIRRSNLAFDSAAALQIADDGCAAFGWGPEESASQIDQLKKNLVAAATPAPARADT